MSRLSRDLEVSSPSRPMVRMLTSKRRVRVRSPPLVPKMVCDSLSTSAWMRSTRSASRSMMASSRPTSTAVPVMQRDILLLHAAEEDRKARGSA